jgi:hypothetical protein
MVDRARPSQLNSVFDRPRVSESVEKRYPRDRRADAKRRARVMVTARSNKPRVERHPMFGEIPLIKVIATGLRGQDLSWWRYDPEYEPPLPRGAVRGNVKRQVFCYAHHVPKYFYLDEPRSCVQCGEEFTFRAAEQKHWYEALQFNFSSVPVRCLACRRRRRSEHALREQIARAKAAVRASADDPAAHLSLARAIAEYHERTEQGDLNQAISAARKAATLWPETAEPLFWEGLAHARAGHEAKARDCLRTFVDRARPGLASLRQRAKELLERA